MLGVACDHGEVSTPAEGLARLLRAAETGELDALCARHGVRVMSVFGSAGRGEPGARDLDIGVLAEPGVTLDLLALIADLTTLTRVDAIDLAHLNRAGPVLRERALVGAVPLFESVEGAYFDAQTLAMAERAETDYMRRLNLELMAQ